MNLYELLDRCARIPHLQTAPQSRSHRQLEEAEDQA
jgi:hypothetical protein